MAIATTQPNYEPVVKSLDISRILGNPRNRVARIGVELEGGWKVIPSGIALDHDGSVFRDPVTGGNLCPSGHRAGELPLGPIQPGALVKAMKKYYPHKVDATCGMHVHMSFENLRHYSYLMIPEYQETVIEYLSIWAKKEGFPTGHHIWTRLSGKSPYCQKKFWPDAQVSSPKDHDQNRVGHRYTIIHYCGRLRTIECRVLPMMDTVDQATRAIKHLIDITNSCLVVLGKNDLREKEVVIKGVVELPRGERYEEYFEDDLPIKFGKRSRVVGGV